MFKKVNLRRAATCLLIMLLVFTVWSYAEPTVAGTQTTEPETAETVATEEAATEGVTAEAANDTAETQ